METSYTILEPMRSQIHFAKCLATVLVVGSKFIRQHEAKYAKTVLPAFQTLALFGPLMGKKGQKLEVDIFFIVFFTSKSDSSSKTLQNTRFSKYHIKNWKSYSVCGEIFRDCLCIYDFKSWIFEKLRRYQTKPTVNWFSVGQNTQNTPFWSDGHEITANLD